MKKVTTEQLRQQLVLAEARAADSDWRVRMQGRKDVATLQSRIKNREYLERKSNADSTAR